MLCVLPSRMERERERGRDERERGPSNSTGVCTHWIV